MERERRDFYKEFIQNSQDFFFVIDRDYKLVHANDAYTSYYKKLSGEDLKLNVSVLENNFSEEYRVKWNEYYRKAFNERLSQVIESAYNPETEQIDHALVKFSPYKNKQGEVELLHCFATHLETTSLKYQEKLVNDYNSGTNIIATIGKSGHILFITKNIEQWGFEQQNLIGKTLSVLVPEEKKGALDGLLHQSLSEDQEKSFTSKNIAENKIYHWKWQISPDQESQTIHVEIIDVTESKATNQKLDVFDKAINHASEAILVNSFDQENNFKPKITYVNPAFEKVTGYRFAEVEGKSPEFLLGDYLVPKEFTKLINTLKTGKVVDVETIHVTKDKTEFWVQVRITPILDENELLESSVSIFKDITAEKRQALQIDLMNSVSEIIDKEDNLNNALKGVANEIAEKLYYDLSEIWLPDKQTKTLNKASEVHKSEVGEDFLLDTVNDSSFNENEGLPGEAWNTQEPITWTNLKDKEEFVRSKEAKKAGLKTMTAIPLVFNDEVTAVITAGSKKEQKRLTLSEQVLKNVQQDLSSKLYWKKVTAELRMTFQHAPQLIGIMDMEGVFVKINKKGLQLMERSEQEVIGKNLAESLPSLVYDEKESFLDHLNDDSPDYEFTTRHVIKDGKIRWMNWSCQLEIQKELIFITARDISYEKKIEELLDDATTLSRIGGWEVDLINESVFWSDMVYEIHEEDPDNYTPLLEEGISFYRQDFREVVQNALHEAMTNGSHFDFEAPIITKKGNEVWVRSIGQPEFIGDKCIRLWGSFQDITERKKDQLRLKEAFEERQSLLSSIADIFIAFDNDWNVTYWNEKAEEVFGTTEKEIFGKNVWEVFPESVDGVFYKSYHKAKKTGHPETFEEYLEAIGIWAEVTAYPSEEGLSVFFKDITLRKKADARLEAANERFRKITEATTDAIWDWDIAAEKSFLGKGFKKLIGVSKETDTKGLWRSSLHPDDRERVLDSVEQSLKDLSADRWEQEYRLIDQQQNVKEVIDQGMIIRDQQGKAIRMLGAISDITYIKEHSNQLEELNQSLEEKLHELEIAYEELERFTYIASHDLQEPLRMVASFLNQLEKNYASDLDERAKKYIHFAKDGAKRMKKVILDLLEYSRAGNFKNKEEEVSLSKLMEDYKTLRRRIIDEKEAKIIYDELPTIKAIKVGVEQVLFNLIDNAIKYVADDVIPEVRISVSDEEKRWVISVKDNGIGIDEEYFDKIFTIFQRLHDHDVFEGTGVGLSIVKKTVESWGGQIWVDSTKDHGSCFYFTINKPKQ